MTGRFVVIWAEYLAFVATRGSGSAWLLVDAYGIEVVMTFSHHPFRQRNVGRPSNRIVASATPFHRTSTF